MFEHLTGTHDLGLSTWGPYTKRYMGFSHIPEIQSGCRFDVSVFPGLYRRKLCIPNVMWESDYHPWKATADLSYVCHRHDIEWKDQVYCDISYLRVSEEEVLVRSEFVNNTVEDQNAVLHYMASMNFPPTGPYSTSEQPHPEVCLPGKAQWQDALEYTSILETAPKAHSSLMPDACLLGEISGAGFVKGQGIGGFGPAISRIGYTVRVSAPYNNAVLVLRYRLAAGKKAKIQLTTGPVGMKTKKIITLEGKEGLTTKDISLGAISKGSQGVVLESLTKTSCDLDGFVLVEKKQAREVTFSDGAWQHTPQLIKDPGGNWVAMKYDRVKPWYGMRWEGEHSEVREFPCKDLDIFFERTNNQNVQHLFDNSGEGHFTNGFVRPLNLKPKSNLTVYGMIITGSKKKVVDDLKNWQVSRAKLAEQFAAAEALASLPTCNPSGSPFTFSQEKMTATTLSNVVYPVRARGEWIRHSTPGRWWDCLYTWDSGFIGLGLVELDKNRALENLNAYVTDPGCEDAAFIHHGSPVPVQFYLFFELWNKVESATESRALLEFFYPRLQQYHRFLAGRLGSSTTRNLSSNLLRTWDYFYNSGGWDDYPPQQHVHKQGLAATVSPVVNTAHAIRTAKFMRLMASELGLDTAEYDEDIEIFSAALQEYSWDEESGYFGYVKHTSQGKPTGIMRHEDGTNFNMGLGGASPLVSGICTPGQEKRLVEALMSPERMWSRCGLSTVDQSASYYKPDGYWNGSVWMPHQWFMWKALLSAGKAKEAHKIAKTGLELWKKEVELSYHCFEHFIVKTGRGAGWHSFGGLSTPVLSWFYSYHVPGRVTTGYDTVVLSFRWGADKTSFSAKLWHTSNSKATLIVTLKARKETFKVSMDGVSVQSHERYPGCLEITLPSGEWRKELNVG